VFVAFGIQRAMRMHSYLWPAPLYNIFPRYLIIGTIFEKKKRKKGVEDKKSVLIFSTTFVWHISRDKKSWVRSDKMYIGP
jgi:hypothetical protein